MWFAGPIACPNCQCPISDEAYVCPYCHSTEAAAAPWHWWPSAGACLIAAILFLAAWSSDRLFGTSILSQAWSVLQKASEN